MDTRLLGFYGDHLRRYGVNDPRGLGWRNRDSQRTRFKVLCEVGDLNGASILDEGCGVGDLYPYIQEYFHDFRYTGIDINEEAIAAAQQKYPKAEFEAIDFSSYEGGTFDYVLSSGALTFRIENHKEVYESHIRTMFELAGIGVAVNMLDKNAIHEDDEYIGYDPEEMRAFCETFAPRVELRHDYADDDFTLYLYH